MREPPRRYKRLRRRGPQFVRQSHCFARSTCAVVTEPSYRACAACRKVIGDWVFHQGVAPRSESTFDVLLGASTTWSNSLWRSTTACLRHKVRPSREEMASLQLGSCGWARAPVRAVVAAKGVPQRRAPFPVAHARILVATDEVGSRRSLQCKMRGSASHHEARCALAQSGGTV